MRRVWPLFSTRTRVPVNAGPFNDGVAAYRRGDYAKALRYLRPLAEQGDCGAQNNLGVMYKNGRGLPQDNEEAVGWYCKAAEHGYGRAQYNLGVMYATGEGVPLNYISAHMWFNIATALGNERAQQALGSAARLMTADQTAKAQRLASKWKRKHQ